MTENTSYRNPQQLLTPNTPSIALPYQPSFSPSPLSLANLPPLPAQPVESRSTLSELFSISTPASEKRQRTEAAFKSQSYIPRPLKRHANGYQVAAVSARGFTTPAHSAKKVRLLAGSEETLGGALVPQPFTPLPPLPDNEWKTMLEQENLRWRCFQTRTVDALLEGKDGFVVARTGSGKSMLWALPFKRVKDRIVIVAFPLKALPALQQLELARFGIRSVVASGDNPSDTLLRQVLLADYDVLLTTYEFLASTGFASLLKTDGFANRILYTVLDEVHYLIQAESYRQVMRAFDKLRSSTHRRVPLLAVTATATPDWRTKIASRLDINLEDPQRTFYRNFGHRRPEISTWIGSISPKGYKDLAFVVSSETSDPNEIPQTLIYVDDRPTGLKILYFLQDRLRSALKSAGTTEVDVTGIKMVHSDLTDDTLKEIYGDFANGKLRVLIATEVYGAGANPPNVRRVIQWGVAPQMSVEQMVQRRGRAARAGGTGVFYFFVGPGDMKKTRESAQNGRLDSGIFSIINVGPTTCIEELESLIFQSPLASGTLDQNLCRCGNCYTWESIPCSSFCCDPSLKPPVDSQPGKAKKTRASGYVHVSKEEKALARDALIRWRWIWFRDVGFKWSQRDGPERWVSNALIEVISDKIGSIRSEHDISRLCNSLYVEKMKPLLYHWVETIYNEILKRPPPSRNASQP